MVCNIPFIFPLQKQSGSLLEIVNDIKYLGMSWSTLPWRWLEIKYCISREFKIKFSCTTVETVLLLGRDFWVMNASTQKLIDGLYTRVLRVETYLRYWSHKFALRGLGLTGHCQKYVELRVHHFVLWEPTHGKSSPGRLCIKGDNPWQET